nr:hypothetical protein [Candidatus Acidoferrales bacterium]
MIPKSKYPKSDDNYDLCPVPMTHRRLTQAHLLWHQTLDNYHDPDGFRANLNATIEALRNVTFVLQKEKHAFKNFDEWYGPWQERLRTDTAAKWAHEARTTVVHKGELESASTAEVRLIDWQDKVVAKMDVPIETPTSLILQNLKLLELIGKSELDKANANDAAVAIERRWTTPDLGGLEILETLSQVFGLLSEIVLDAHITLQKCDCIPVEQDHPNFRSVHHRTGTLECMSSGASVRTQTFQLSSGTELTLAERTASIFVGEIDVKDRYGLTDEHRLTEWESLDPLKFAEKILYAAKRMLCKDKHHVRLMFIRDGGGHWSMANIFAADRTEKHLIMRMIAHFVASRGCDAIVDVGEAWFAPASMSPELDLDAIQNPSKRGEALFLVVATRDGVCRKYT